MAEEGKRRERFEKWAKECLPNMPLYKSKLELGEYSWLHARDASAAWCGAERSVVSDIVEKMQVRADTLGHPSFDYVRAFVELRRLIAELKKEYGL